MKGLPAERLWAQVDKAGECWLWLGAQNNRGYGTISIKSRGTPVHRLAYELLVGPIPEGLELDHLCRVRLCVNPAHLEPVTHAENARRYAAAKAAETHCKRGHPWAENTYVAPAGYRMCRACVRLRQAKYRLER